MKGIRFVEDWTVKPVPGKHTYYDWGLLLASADVPPTRPKTTYVDIPGGHGTLDLSEFNGGIKYKDREMKFVFYMKLSQGVSDDAYEEKKRQILELIDGRELSIVLDETPERYFLGRCVLDDWSSDKLVRSFVIVAKTKPFWFKKAHTEVRAEIKEGYGKEFTLTNEGVSVKPIIFANRDITLSCEVAEGQWEEHLVECKKTATGEPIYDVTYHDIVLHHGTNKISYEPSPEGLHILFRYTERGL